MFSKLRKRIKLNKRQKIFVFLFMLLILVVLVLLYFNYIVNPVILQMSQAKVQSLTQKAVNSAVYDIINNGPIYDDMITISRDPDGNVTLITTDSLQINQLTRELVKAAQVNLELIGEDGIDIPVGTFSGMPIFVGRGPSVKIHLLPIGVISCTFVSEFTNAGINQTNHKIYVNVNSRVSVVLPTANQQVATTTQLLVAESIIVGKVPDTYLSSDSLEEMLNLVPI